MGKTTPARTHLYARTRKEVDDLADQIRNKLDPWTVGFASNVRFETTDFYGKKISYQGVAFGGSTREVFWGGYIEPFLKHGIVEILDKKVEQCRESKLRPKKPLEETSHMLRGLVVSTYHRMAEIDWRLCNAGHELRAPGTFELINRRDVSGQIARMEEFIDGQLKASKCMASHSWQPGWGDKKAWVMSIVRGVILVAVGIALKMAFDKVFPSR